jgi:hypothetical protein
MTRCTIETLEDRRLLSAVNSFSACQTAFVSNSWTLGSSAEALAFWDEYIGCYFDAVIECYEDDLQQFSLTDEEIAAESADLRNTLQPIRDTFLATLEAVTAQFGGVPFPGVAQDEVLVGTFGRAAGSSPDARWAAACYGDYEASVFSNPATATARPADVGPGTSAVDLSSVTAGVGGAVGGAAPLPAAPASPARTGIFFGGGYS